jgi:hypothetical protein
LRGKKKKTKILFIASLMKVRKSVPPMRWAGVLARDGEKSGRESRGFEHVWNCFSPELWDVQD